MSHIAPDVAASARDLVRRGLKGALATLDAASGAPYASMVLTATDFGGAPLILISTLARHTRNLAVNPSASLMIDVSNAAGDAESGGRITLMGAFRTVSDDAVLSTARGRFVARHPAAAGYADFGDFAFYRFDVASAHFIEGFGRIIPLTGAALSLPPYDAEDFLRSGSAAVAELRRQWPGVTGLDCEGVDLRSGASSLRYRFAQPVKNVVEALREASRLLSEATSPMGSSAAISG